MPTKKPYKKALFIFRRDLRLADNNGLALALAQSELVIPCFIFDPRQVGAKNDYRSENAIQFMVESLIDLDEQLHAHGGKLYLFAGTADAVIKKLLQQEDVDAVFCNRDYTPFSVARDEAIKKTCDHHGVKFTSCADALLNEPEAITSQSGTPYSVFTAFYKRARTVPVAQPNQMRATNFYKKPIKLAHKATEVYTKAWNHDNKQIHVHGGSEQALKILRSIKNFEDYATDRNIPALQTTNLSAHLKFGTVSIRQAYHTIKEKLGATNPLLQQLYWCDFFTHVAYHSPFVFGEPFHEKYKKLVWSKNAKNFNAWCTGNTGFPIVDAGMRQLNATGFMHNRVRMIVASFLVKDLHVDWRAGEKYFAQQLVDYDPAVNNGNWQWCASTGCDAQPYFRIFNPWLQQKKFDPDCVYIKRWVPELAKADNKIIHSWFKESSPPIKKYPRPIVDHATESTYAKKMYKNA